MLATPENGAYDFFYFSTLFLWTQMVPIFPTTLKDMYHTLVRHLDILSIALWTWGGHQMSLEVCRTWEIWTSLTQNSYNSRIICLLYEFNEFRMRTHLFPMTCWLSWNLHTENTEFQNFITVVQGTQCYRNSKWLCGSWSSRRD